MGLRERWNRLINPGERHHQEVLDRIKEAVQSGNMTLEETYAYLNDDARVEDGISLDEAWAYVFEQKEEQG